MVLGKLPPSPNSNANPKPNPDRDQGAIFLGGNFPDTVLNTMYTIKLHQKQLWRNLASVNLKLKKSNYLLRVQPELFALAFLTLEVSQQVA